MAIKLQNFRNNDDVTVLDKKGSFSVLQYDRDLSLAPSEAIQAYFCAEMNVKRRQVMCELRNTGVTLQPGAMQWMGGNVQQTTGISSAGDLLGKALRGKVTGEAAIKPEYKGTGFVVLEPTYKHILLEDLADWGGSMIIDDGLFMACESTVNQKAVMRNNLSSATLGGEGLFNLQLSGSGVVCLESSCPREELIIIDLENDVVKIDGNMAIAWSPSLQFTVERSGKSLMGSAASGEGLVNVYRGTGRILMMPVR